jgi:iron complex outermembrane receptor protein
MRTAHDPRLFVLAALLAAAPSAARAEDLADLSLEELANLEVTSVSRRAERLADAPASLFVITGEDIRRSGATSLPEALRLAPNLEVARIDARQYAISARGFNNAVGNKLLVLIDGRTIYTPLFSGVFWDAQDTLLEDIERIEVISGPGGTQWGANAVNGVINVITRRATGTVGTVAEAGFGNLERGLAARQGFALDGGGAVRVYGKFFEGRHGVRANGAAVPDEWHNGQAGFRGDWGTAASQFTLQGDAYRGSDQQGTTGVDARFSGGNVLARWNRQLAATERLQLQAYLDNTTRDVPGSFGERLDTLDLDLQHGFQAMPGHALTWGGGHRRSYDHVTNSAMLAFLPASKTLKWTNAFLQDEITLQERLRLTLGAKIESNPYTGWEFLPSLRLAWKPEPSQLVWGALSRAVRAPSRLDRELFVPGQPPFILAGGPDFRSEIAKVFELGYRAQPSARVSYSVTGFYAIYDHLRTVEPGGAGPLVLGNKMEGKTRGLEGWGTYQVSSAWRLSAGALFLAEDLRLKPGSGDTTGVAAAGNDPKHQFTLRSSLDLTGEQQLDIMARHVGELPNPRVAAYTAIDARYAWRLRRDFEVSATLQNMFDRRHAEFGAAASRLEIERGLFLRLKWSR